MIRMVELDVGHRLEQDDWPGWTSDRPQRPARIRGGHSSTRKHIREEVMTHRIGGRRTSIGAHGTRHGGEQRGAGTEMSVDHYPRA
jgi:hypothetical protein